MLTNLGIIFFNIALGMLFLHYQDKDDVDYRRQYIWCCCLVLALQSGLRHVAVGADTFAYKVNFEFIMQSNWEDVWLMVRDYYGEAHLGKDPGYAVIEKLFSEVCPFYQGWLLFVAFFFFCTLGRFLSQNCNSIPEAMLGFTIYSTLFYSFFSVTGIRQTLATACCLIGYELIVKKKLIFFLLIILLASTVHKSCLIFIPFYFLVNFYHGKRYYWLAAVVIPLSFYFQTQILEFCQLWGYENYDFYDAGGTPVFTFLLISIAIFVGIQLKVVRGERPEVDNYCKALICALLFTPLTWFNPSAMRIVQYFSFFLIVLIPVTISGMQPIPMRKVFFCVALICLPLLYANNSMSHSYRLWFQDMPLAPHYR